MSEENFQIIHSKAVANGERVYTDPATGYRVITELGHLARGSCCGCGCRHCPYAHEQVPASKRATTAKVPTLVNESFCTTEQCDVLFWSGGKDSYLSYQYLKKEFDNQKRDIVLLTTFDGATRIVAHQEVEFSKIEEQSTWLRSPLLAVPLFTGMDYVDRISSSLKALSKRYKIKRLVFGDLHLENIRNWRETSFAPLLEQYGVTLHFPIWQEPYDTLVQELERSGVSIRITAVCEDAVGGRVKVGETFSADFMETLPSEVDGFGENGEFHTYVGPK